MRSRCALEAPDNAFAEKLVGKHEGVLVRHAPRRRRVGDVHDAVVPFGVVKGGKCLSSAEHAKHELRVCQRRLRDVLAVAAPPPLLRRSKPRRLRVVVYIANDREEVAVVL